MESHLKGKKIWKLRKRHGSDLKYKTPTALWNKAVTYFEWVEANPMQSAELVTFRGDHELAKVPKMRAMTLDSLCLHLGITHKTWRNYMHRPEFERTCLEIEMIINEQKFTGAAAGLLSANIISRDLGLKEQAEITGKGGGPIETIQLDPELYKEIRRQMLEDDDC